MTPKIKVGFHLENKGHPQVDLRIPEKGNPGIGGTQFTTLATAYYLNQLYPDQLEILLLANHLELFPPSLSVCHAESLVDAAIKSEKEGCDIFIFKSAGGGDQIYDQLRKLKIKAVARSNNTPDRSKLNQIADCSQIKAHVCVGHEQLDLLRDHRVFPKSTRIFNPFNVEYFKPKTDIVKSGNTVVFVGNIIYSKGFHHLARVWKKIIQAKSDAKLVVIGSGQLYDRNQLLGKWGVAEEAYEAKWIRPFLSDENGNLLDSVNFLGLLGEEKIGILQQADVGVANPSGLTETFCSVAVEFQACGTPVVSGANGGLLDTVIHGKTGLLGHNDRDLVRNILYLLNNPSIAQQFGENGLKFVQEKFDYRENARQWLALFIDIDHDRLPQQPAMKPNYMYNAKFIRESMRIMKQFMPFLHPAPALIEIKPLLKTYLKKIK
ncbi:glycosyl transferase, group 1 family protein [Coleofasciculus chthonoplastes PCC 7420]|uniref:Glycosyl transferase, group 1 family protein n=1 Tax=Coleofasciculus chthonoplastes PCC 7420 TaxID=118168 RepID=B4W5D3_9CYAN|nr:glycosyltransferase family 4 protein [Coleofasciculus chthonoplastes]EDX70599.1 glycosyl transferase, group 1 family protein [Coleofasciculus chthonoplastes PCC 7420]